jgi:hypothetical protein
MKKLGELLLLATLAFAPLRALPPVAAGTTGGCNGAAIGRYCDLVYGYDATKCEDCVTINCQVGCIGHTAQEYYYCHQTGFLFCVS